MATVEEFDPLELPECLRARAFEEFQETSELRKTSLVELRSRIAALEKESDRVVDTCNKNLVRFLRSRKYDIEEALQSTIKYQHFLNQHHEALSNITPEEVRYFGAEFLSVLHERGGENRVIFVMRPSKGIKLFTADLKRDNPRAMLRYNFWMFENISHDPYVQVCGLVIVNCFQGMTMWDQMAMSNMAPVGDQLATFQHFQALGTRFKGAYILEEPAFMSWLWFFIKPFMSEKIKARFFLCGHDYDQMRSAIHDPAILPKFLGGDLDDDDPSLSTWIQSHYDSM